MSMESPRSEFRPLEYSWAYDFMTAQKNHPWTHNQIGVESDVAQYHTEFTEAEKHGITTILKLFTTYEIHVGNYWVDVIYRIFPKHEIRMMALAFAAMEGEHALFYDKLNTALGISSKEFYLSFMEEPAMKERMEVIEKAIELGVSEYEEDAALSLATFSIVEGVILYSSFAFLMSFQQPPKNKLKNTCTGLAYSVRDELIHADADSKLFNVFVKERQVDRTELDKKIIDMAKKSFELESVIIDNIFSKGKIEGITDHQLKEFVKSRVNRKLKDIDIPPIYEVSYNPISKWFYKSISSVEFSDFFDRNPTDYTSNWDFNKIKGW